MAAKAVFAALIWAALCCGAAAQPVCPITPAVGTSSTLCSSTAFVHAVAGYFVVNSSVDFNSSGDTTFTVKLPAAHYRVRQVVIRGLTGTFGTARAGVFTAASGGGAAIAAQQVVSLSSVSANTAGNAFSLSLNQISLSVTSLFFNVGTPQGATATGAVYIYLQPES